jgi:L-seryl-tRNA(Ser) seleniumtransferase
VDSGEKQARAAAYRAIPAVDRLLSHPAWEGVRHVGPTVRRDACRAVVAALRAAIGAGEATAQDCGIEQVAQAAVERAKADVRPLLRPVINATGVILHTNLGRAPLSTAALDAIAGSAGRYTNLEMDLDSGVRDNRMDRIGASFARLLDCGDVVVGNNNAATVFLALTALASGGGGVVISRGELVEIGGSFRMPDIMDASGAAMVEVGTTNRTHAKDYRAALEAGAKVVLKVHQSNFAVVGFTKEVEVEELAALAHEHGALLVHDLGSGLLRSRPELGRDCVRRSLDAGVDLVLFSGDKLLGGPQCGIAAGRPEVVARLRACPVLRLVRPGKLTMLALEATLRAWERDPDGGEIPCAVATRRDPAELEATARRLADEVAEVMGDAAQVEVVPVQSTPGGGSSALLRLDSSAVAVRPLRGSDDELAATLRRGDPAIVARIEDGRLLFDVRTLLDGDDRSIVEALRCASAVSGQW